MPTNPSTLPHIAHPHLGDQKLGLRRVLRRGLRFEAGAPVGGTTLRARLLAGTRTHGTFRRRSVARGRVRATLKLSRRGKLRLRRLLAERRRARVTLKVGVGGTTARARFTIRR